MPRHGIIHEIDTGTSAPCRAKVRHILPNTEKYNQGYKSWMELEKLGIIEKISPGEPTTWSSPLHLAPKCDGSLRPCGDYRALNDRTLLDHYPLPNLRHFSANLKGARVFSKVDMVKSYHQIPLSRQSSAKTTVLSPWGPYRFLRLAMGLRNAAQSFQKLMNSVLDGLEGLFCYLDDILIYSKTEEEHLIIIDKLFSRLNEAGLTISLKKCQFGRPSLNFLGFHVTGDGIRPLPKKTEAITKFPPPARPKDLLGFLGAVNYYRRSLPHLEGQSPAQVLAPLYEAATKVPAKDFSKHWTANNLQNDFDKAKKLLTLATELVHPDPQLPLALVTDASKEAIGGCLQQLDKGQWQPLGFFSRQLKSNEKNWSCFKRELYAVQQSIRHFLSEINGRHLTVYSDHLPLISAFKNPQSMQFDQVALNQLNEVGQWTQDVRYLPGRDNCAADAMSRPPANVMGTNNFLTVDKDAPELDVTTVDAIECSNYASRDSVGSAAETTTTPPDMEGAALVINTVDPFQLQEAQQTCPDVARHIAGNHVQGLHIKKVEFAPGVWLWCDVSNNKKSRPIVPKTHRQTLIKLFHQISHPGNKETLRKVSDRYYWPNIRSDVSAYVTTCHDCLAAKNHNTIVPPMDPRPVLQPRFQDVQIDVVGPLPISEGCQYLLTAVCRTSRWFEAIPMPEATTKSCSTAFIRGWIRNFGLPRRISSDNASTFTSRLWTALQEELGIFVDYAPTYAPWAVGTVERQHRDLKNSIRAALIHMADTHQSNWQAILPWVLLARRTSFHSELQATPSEFVLGEVPLVPGDLSPDLPADHNLAHLLERLKHNAKRPPAQTKPPQKEPTALPNSATTATHIYFKRAKVTPLGPRADGPYKILERLGKSCLKVATGYFNSGSPMTEVVHWRNCTPVTLPEDTVPASRPKRGRPKKQSTE